MAQITLKALDELAKKMDDKLVEKSTAEAAVKVINKEISAMSSEILKHLEENDREEYVTPYGKLKVKNDFQITSPKGDKKLEFVSYLKDIGIFDQVASVHATTIKTMAKEKYTKDLAAGADPMTWEYYGVKPTTFRKVDLTGRKKESKGIESDDSSQEE